MTKKKLLIILIPCLVVLAGIGALVLAPDKTAENGPENSQPPKLFGQDDYKIEERADGKYVVIPKVGFSTKVPTGWTSKIDCQETAPDNFECWTIISSVDMQIKNGLVATGCSVSISAIDTIENNEEAKEQIKILKENGATSTASFRKDYDYQIINVGQYEALSWLSPEKPIIGQFAGINIPIGNTRNINLDTTFPPNYKEQCEPIWEGFVKSVIIQ